MVLQEGQWISWHLEQAPFRRSCLLHFGPVRRAWRRSRRSRIRSSISLIVRIMTPPMIISSSPSNLGFASAPAPRQAYGG
jgi:hypothetical protein